MPAKPSSNNLEVFNFNTSPYEVNSIRVENISAHATVHEVVELFRILIGDVKSFSKHQNSSGGFLEIGFFTHDAARKALCMSGYNFHGAPLFVVPFSASSNNPPTRRQSDDRKNLYVLGLPFSLTKAEFMALFSRYGTVTHSVILATVDNSSRRRGFVVMSCHEEAKLAMTSLTRTQIKGHVLDVSWAVVQRSQGFLDGGDRAMLLDLRPSPNPSPRPPTSESPDVSANSSTSSINSNEEELATLAPSPVPTATIFVTNLPTLLFSDAKDMSPLLCPFGRLKKLNLMKSLSNGSNSVIAEYESAEAAQEAKRTLHGQYYIGHEVAVCFVRQKSAILELASIADTPHYNTGLRSALNHHSSTLLGPLRSCSAAAHLHRYNHSRQVFNNIQNVTPRASPLPPMLDYRPRNHSHLKENAR